MRAVFYPGMKCGENQMENLPGEYTTAFSILEGNRSTFSKSFSRNRVLVEMEEITDFFARL